MNSPQRYKIYAENGSVIVEDTTDGWRIDIWDEITPGDAAELNDDPEFQEEAADRIAVSREGELLWPSLPSAAPDPLAVIRILESAETERWTLDDLAEAMKAMKATDAR